MKRNYKYNVGDIVINKYNEEFKILEQTKGSRGQSSYICECSKKHIFPKMQTKILTSCPYCTNRIIEKGINDISTTNKEMFDMLVDKEFGYTHCETSQERTDWECPDCHCIIHNRKPYDVLYFGLHCPCCYDGISYGEKFMANFLNEIGVDFIYQLTSKKVFWCENFMYDFYIPSIDCIIEVQGAQHYRDCSWGKYEDIHKNDLDKKELALKYVDKYIEINASKSTFNFMKNSIINSGIINILGINISTITWENIHENSNKSIINLVANKYNKGITNVRELSNIFQVCQTTIVNYLKTASQYGKCNYDPQKAKLDTLNYNHKMNCERKNVKSIICLDDGKVFRNCKILENKSIDIYGVHLNYKNIHAVCRGEYKTSKGLTFKYISHEEFNKFKQESPENAYGDFFIA